MKLRYALKNTSPEGQAYLMGVSEKGKFGCLTKWNYENYIKKYCDGDEKKLSLFQYLRSVNAKRLFLYVDEQTLVEKQTEWGWDLDADENGNVTFYVEPVLIIYLNSIACEEIALPGTEVYIGVSGMRCRDLPVLKTVRTVHFRKCEDLDDYVTWAGGGSEYSFPFANQARVPLSRQSGKQKADFFLKVIRETGDSTFSGIGNLARILFYRGIYDHDNPAVAVSTAFDYIFYISTCVLYCFMWKKGMVPDEKLIRSCKSLKTIAGNIAKWSTPEYPCDDRIRNQRVVFPETLKRLHRKLCKYLPFSFKEDSFSFQGLMSFLNEVRNLTKGHGVLQDRFAGILLKTLLYHISFLHRFLAMESFRCFTVLDFTSVGYNDKGIEGISPFFRGDYTPDLLWECKKNKYKYMNFFEGLHTVPAIKNPES